MNYDTKIDVGNRYNEAIALQVNSLSTLCYNRSLSAGWHTNIKTGKLIDRNKGELI